MELLVDYNKNHIRLTKERLEHIERRMEMEGQKPRIKETLETPDTVRESDNDPSVHLYYKKYTNTPVTEKYLLVVVKTRVENPFIITSFFTDKIKTGRTIFSEG